MKKKLILSSILSIVMCLSLICGATFALFTSEDKVNIAITSGTVKIEAYTSNLKTYSSTAKDVFVETDVNGVFANTGTAAITGNQVTIERMTPGDKVTFTVDVKNSSNVTAKYRVLARTYDDTGLTEEIKVSFTDKNGKEISLLNGAGFTAWTRIDGITSTEAQIVDTITVAIELPWDAVKQGVGCKYELAVEAVQGNADVVDPFTKVGERSYEINNAEGLSLMPQIAKSHNTNGELFVSFKLTNDVDMNGYEYNPTNQQFLNFDGGNHTISNLTAGVAQRGESGLFGYAANVSNVTLENVSVEGSQAGLVMGRNVGAKISNVTIKGTNYVKYNKDANPDETWGAVGAIVGANAGSNVENVVIADDAKIYIDYNGLITEWGFAYDGLSTFLNPLSNVTFNANSIETTGVWYKKIATEEALLDALTSNDEVINLVVANDMSLNLGTSTKLGGVDTKEININGVSTQTYGLRSVEDKTEITFTDSYRTYVAATNPEAIINFNNVVINRVYSKTETTWDGYNISFNTPVTITDSIINHPVNFASKAVITDTDIIGYRKDLTGEVNTSTAHYAVWVEGYADVTIKGGSIVGNRGIKVDGEYVIYAKEKYDTADALSEIDQFETKLSVTDTKFELNGSKSAILLKVKWADVTVSNVNIIGVLADPIHPVWKDEDLPLRSGTVAEGGYDISITIDGKAVDVANIDEAILGEKVNLSNADQLLDVMDSSDTVIGAVLGDGNYQMPDSSESVNLRGKTLTITGTKDTIIDASDVDARDQFVTGANLVFDGVTINFGYEIYMGFANTVNLIYRNCHITGLQCLYGENVTFENCVIDSSANTGEPHAVWTYGAKNITFNNCEFIYGNRAINCYKDQDIDGGKQVVNFNNCTFTTTDANSEGAVEINSSAFSVGIEVNLTGCTAPSKGEMAYVSKWDGTNGAKTTINIK